MRGVSAALTALLLLTVALSAAGCGGDSGESAQRPETATTAPGTTTTPDRGGTPGSTAAPPRGTLTAAQYRKTVNRLCREDKAAADRLGDIDAPESIAPFLRRSIKYARKREPLYERLRPPAGLRANHRASLRLNDQAELTLTKLLARIEGGGDPVREFTKAAPALARVINSGNQLSRRMGTRDCIVEVPSPSAQPPQSPS